MHFSYSPSNSVEHAIH